MTGILAEPYSAERRMSRVDYREKRIALKALPARYAGAFLHRHSGRLPHEGGRLLGVIPKPPRSLRKHY